MNKKRQQEMAFLILKEVVCVKGKNGICLGPKTRCKFVRKAKKMGLPPEEVIEFAKILLKGLVDETFEKPSKK